MKVCYENTGIIELCDVCHHEFENNEIRIYHGTKILCLECGTECFCFPDIMGTC